MRAGFAPATDVHQSTKMNIIHPPTQEATAVKLWRNAQWVSSEALAPGLRSLHSLLRRSRQGGHAWVGSAEDTKGTTAVRPPQ